ncbi:MAG: hypothetical protein VYA30_01675, partial [Myxococcota bacterium]|nr:hypothetical protein [Myxococcota bacterium]
RFSFLCLICGARPKMGIKLSIEIEIDGAMDPTLRELTEAVLRLALKDASVSAVTSANGSEEKPRVKKRLRRPPDRPKLTGTPEQQWLQFQAKAPGRTREFAELVKGKEPDFLMQEEAMRALEISEARAIGGLTGSMRRWAVADGIELPWSATKIDGQRAWIWRGFDESGDLLPPPHAYLEIERELAPPATYEEYFERLPKRSQKFLNYIEKAGTATLQDAMDALGIDNPKALGGLAGSLNRWGRAAGLPVPFVTERVDDKKCYRWVGLNPETSRPKVEASAANAADATPDPVATIAQLTNFLPDRHCRFLDYIQGNGTASVGDALHQLALEKASGIPDVLKSIQSVCAFRGLSYPIEEHTDASGNRFWTLSGWSKIQRQPVGEPMEEPTVGSSVGPGVRRRRQRV